MKISLNWLKQYVDVDVSDAELSDIFTSLGIEVQSAKHVGLQKQRTLVVGEIQRIEQHPNADKLLVCQVCVGMNDVRQIVCGAKNFKLFDHVPVAMPGTILPNGVKIDDSKLRGVQSHGMMCSGYELGIGNDHSGLLILGEKTKIGANLFDVLDVSPDVIFDLSITANRGDCLSYIGIARELACKTGKRLRIPLHENIDIRCQCEVIKNIEVKSSDCSCYYAFCITGIKVKPSPDWLVRNLEGSGLKSINNVVDICNWVMLETGNPLHAFDLDKITDRNLYIRHANDGEWIIGLDSKRYDLTSDVTVIADSKRPLVIAGVMGGIDAGIDNSTTCILIESACFNQPAIMRTSRMLGISTDSAHRFARSVDASTCEQAGWRAIGMILGICGGEYVQKSIAKQYNYSLPEIKIDHWFMTRRLGFKIDPVYASNILSALGFNVKFNVGTFYVSVPSHRHDIQSPIDIIGECLRIYGTDRIGANSAKLTSVHRNDASSYTFCLKTKQLLAAHGFFECYNYSLTCADLVKFVHGTGMCLNLSNPLLSDQDCYRNSILSGLLSTLRLNVQNGNIDSKFFEIGRIAVEIGGKFSECLSVAFIILENNLNRAVGDVFRPSFICMKKLCFDILANVADTGQINLQTIDNSKVWQPEYSAKYCHLDRVGIDIRCGLLNKKILKSIFDLKSNVFAAEIIISDKIFEQESVRCAYRQFSQFPRVSRDISVLVSKNELVGDVQHIVEECAKKNVASDVRVEYVKLFDIYSGERIDPDKKALGFEISFRSIERTLVDAEIQHLFELIQHELAKFYGIRKML